MARQRHALRVIIRSLILGCLALTATGAPAQWRQSFDAGYFDAQGQWVGGSEIMHLAAHGGKLFAANGYWLDARWVIPPEGQKQSAILKAEGEAEARIKVADAEKDAISLLAQSLAGTKGDPAQYLIAVRYLESLKEMTSGKGNKVIYVPYEATGVLSSLGGIKELLSGIGKS